VTAAPPLKVALPKGRLLEPSLALFRKLGSDVSDPATTRKLLVPSSDGTLSFLLVKPPDVPVYVESGAADLGITGTDVLRETGADVLEPLALGFGACRMVVASPASVPFPALSGGVTPRVATKYPRLTRAYFAEIGLGVEVVTVSGSVEVAPLLGLSHWIVDLVDTGRTLQENGLVERAKMLDVGAVVVVNRASQKLKLERHLELLEKLRGAVSAPVSTNPSPGQLHR
jgi:ATP phosphoribosyltransferase